MGPVRRPDPKLEEVRNSVEPRENVHLIATELQTLTSNIHAAFLFTNEGHRTLHKLCLCTGASSVEHWHSFADHLGLSYQQMYHIENYFQTKEDPVSWTLKTYAQGEDATIKEVIHALWKLERYDVLTMINEETRKLVESLSDRINSEEILKPYSKPRVPLVLKRVDEHKTTNNTSISLKNTGKNDNQIVRSPKRRLALAAKVLLTFATDGKEAAQRIAEIFSSNKRKIGVLILEEQPIHMKIHGTRFIDYMLREVDFIIPILSKGYFDKINDLLTGTESQSDSEYDDKYVDYIYNYFVNQYVDNKCTSKKVRSILPNGMTSRDLPHRSPALENWHPESKISKFIELLLIEKKNALRAKKMMQCDNESSKES